MIKFFNEDEDFIFLYIYEKIIVNLILIFFCAGNFRIRSTSYSPAKNAACLESRGGASRSILRKAIHSFDHFAFEARVRDKLARAIVDHRNVTKRKPPGGRWSTYIASPSCITRSIYFSLFPCLRIYSDEGKETDAHRVSSSSWSLHR